MSYPQRNRIPPKAPDHNWTAPGATRRRSVKRRTADEDEDFAAVDSHSSWQKRSSTSVSEPDVDIDGEVPELDTSVTAQRRTASPVSNVEPAPAEEYPTKPKRRKRQTAPDSDAEVDIEGDDAIDSRFMPETSTRATMSSSRFKRRVNDPPPRKKRAVVRSDNDESDFEAENVVGDDLDDPDDEDDFVLENTRPSKSKSAAGKGKNVKVASGTKKKGKGAKEAQQETTIKDERKLPPRRASVISPDKASSSAKRPRAKEPQRTDDLDVESDPSEALETQPSTMVVGEAPTPQVPAPPPPKKQKLPTIRKNKVAGSGGPSTPIASTKSIGSQGGKLNPDDKLQPPNAVAGRKPAAFAGNADFDLRNPSVYSELFKSAGGTTPRSGLNRREKEEERRKELEKMRDEAKKKREESYKNTFDLQSQVEKISRFEEKLRAIRSAALFPNSLGAKWRDEWEKERRRQQKETG